MKSSGEHAQILVATNYFKKWVEAIPTKKATSKVVIDFLNNILSRFGVLEIIVCNNAMCFRSKEFMDFCNQHGIRVSY